MSVSIVICTWNRARLLAQTLEALRRLEIPRGCSWELLVVNNNSTDETDEVLARYERRLPLRRLFESEAGKAHAANRALREAAYDFTIWTDDDVLVDPGWLAAHWRAAVAYPDAAYFGGPVEPLFSREPPAWIRRNLDQWNAAFAVIDLGPATRVLAAEELPFGANVAFRRSALAAVGGFDPKLGPAGDNQIRGEESALVSALCRAGYEGVWVGGARVEHYIPPERLTTKYLRDYFRGAGRTEARRRGRRLPGRSWRGAPLWAVRQLWTCRLMTCLGGVTRGPLWARAARRAWIAEGIIAECRNTGWQGGAPEAPARKRSGVGVC